MAPKHDRERIKQLLAQGLTAKQISERLGCCKSVVSVVKRDMQGNAT